MLMIQRASKTSIARFTLSIPNLPSTCGISSIEGKDLPPLEKWARSPSSRRFGPSLADWIWEGLYTRNIKNQLARLAEMSRKRPDRLIFHFSRIGLLPLLRMACEMTGSFL